MKNTTIFTIYPIKPISLPLVRKAKIEKNTYLMLKQLKPQIINSQSFILSHQTLTTFKIPIKDV